MAQLNLTQLQNVTSLYDMGNVVMAVTNNLFFLVLILCIHIVALLKLTPKYDIATSVAVAGFLSLLLSLPLLLISWINIFLVIGFIIETAISLFIIRATS